MSFVKDLNSLGEDNIGLNALLFVILSLGVLKLTFIGLHLSAMILDLFVLPSTNLSKYGNKKGCYALITGASDGIGKEFAYQLGKSGFNLLLVSRTLSKLESLKNDLESKYSIKVKILSLDISHDINENYLSIKQLCEDVPITILVNNVGQSHSIPVPFLETEEKELRDIITINNTATLMITQTVVPFIIKNSKNLNCKGLVLTMGSFGGLIPTPLLATYSGSKAFLQSWSSSLAGELSKDNIDVQLIISYLVTSNMSKIKRTSLMIPSPKSFVSSTLRNIGRRCGSQERYATITPYWSHAFYHFAIENTVGLFSKLVNSINYKFHLDIRKRALKKASRNRSKQD